MINDQIPITNEGDNDRFTNNQLTKMRGSARLWCLLPFGNWSLVIGCFPVIGIWLLVIVFSLPVFP
jgi:hypothetical protein